ncbi:type VI secretion system tube protein TssD [Citrobacter portucalensis]|uniref:type VI secretion system tube protein TssD n=1 Tax=Citrobacter portucalensis TaxID=1639133 RepID=UPI0016487905|nr:type VI secretion system tube protein TssD [Citrobacter portucalensis]
MSDIVYLMVSGQQQGAISDGCGTIASVGNRWQIGHEDEIFTFSLSNSITSTGRGSHFHGLQFCKLIDKSTPLFVNAINNNEQLYMEFYFYRINRFGRWEKYYYIQLRGVFLSAIQHQFIENNLDTETITINYEYILCKHLIANTEFSYLALPENYNRLFIPRPKTPADNGLKTLNSKGVGRLLAAGGIYNGNIDGFRETAEKLGGDAPAGYEQVLNEKTIGLGIIAASLLFSRNASKIQNVNRFRGVTRKFNDKSAGTIRNVNPGYPKTGHTHNCVNCAIATDATLAGHPASALPVNSTKGVPLSVLEKFYSGKFKPMSSVDEIIHIMSNANSGARGIVYGSYGPGQPGHVFNVANQNNTVRFLDGQTGNGADLNQFKSFQLLRTN